MTKIKPTGYGYNNVRCSTDEKTYLIYCTIYTCIITFVIPQMKKPHLIYHPIYLYNNSPRSTDQ